MKVIFLTCEAGIGGDLDKQINVGGLAVGAAGARAAHTNLCPAFCSSRDLDIQLAAIDIHLAMTAAVGLFKADGDRLFVSLGADLTLGVLTSLASAEYLLEEIRKAAQALEDVAHVAGIFHAHVAPACLLPITPIETTLPSALFPL